ncbi:MAG: adenylate/guanylate cyclase domain-containing protein [Treponema sp.]|uniref:adenylate/guanylate cyclase domain-containing protein n=1 Tax=Treponema sp. TaxID=166 RepID=UPI00298E2E7B|nr:adenylate/guanylate cyclase domain-containing protein [Treponema sp.]MCR5386336.1 adenylate/guanylate cyclase domain-containing protein [Treponema sp.]
MEKAQENKSKIKHSIGFKLVLIISILVLVSLGTITTLVSVIVGNDVSTKARTTNFDMAVSKADAADNELKTLRANVFLMLDMLNATGSSGILSRQVSTYFFERNQSIAAVIIPESKELINTRYFVSNEIEPALINDFLAANQEDVIAAEQDQTIILNATPVFDVPMLACFYPYKEAGFDQAVIIFYAADSLADMFGQNSSGSDVYMVNHRGDLLVHSDFNLVKAGSNMAKSDLVMQMQKDNSDNRQVTFNDEEKVKYFGAYKRISVGDGGIAVLSQIQEGKALAAVTETTLRNIYITFAVLFISVLFIFLYSKTLSNPLKALTAVANEIKQGNFNTELFDELNSKKKKPRNDEIGVLIQSTKDEREILNTVSRLTNKGVAKAIVRKEIDFEPHLKDITIFFSDIRGFTAISDGFNKRFGEKSAGEIISFLNDYMSRMVNCITISGGNVDKFEGDAIMACWGVLRDDSLEFEKMADSDPRKKELAQKHAEHVKKDAINAVRGVLAMRYALMVYNKAAEAFTKEHEGEPLAKYKPHIRIGSGLNSGRATVGFMGSYDKMEFTSIGDAVNLASRTESSNKPCGTDMLITEDTYNLIKMDYIKCQENNFTIKPENQKYEIIVEVIPVTFEVKGKGKQHFYGVVNMPNFDIEEFFKTTDPEFKADPDCITAIGPKGPKTLAEVRTLLGIPTPDFGGVNLDAEESKVTAS